MAMNLFASNKFNCFCNQGNGKSQNTNTILPLKITGNSVLCNGVKKLVAPLRSRRIEVHALYEERDFNQRTSLNTEGEKPYRILRGGRKFYLDELDILTVLDPRQNLVPLDKNYNPAVYLWKKFGDIPEERRHQLLYLLRSKDVTRLWDIAGMRYNDVSGITKDASAMLFSMENKPLLPEYWSGRINGVPWQISWMRRFRKALFLGKEGSIYGRVIPAGSLLQMIANYLSPLYFIVRNVCEVMATEERCDLAFEFGDGQLQLLDLPANFPKPAKNLRPFNDELVVYIRSAGPSVLVGQVWQEGRKLEQVPQKFLGELILIKDYVKEVNSAASTAA
ncbi:uncharacterized protein LOC131036391 isoform X2 [Cryptomeria japonica]|uniref:uncharacterized protein LOC131036391 isoform X2 n=1 Tax=Cryptomeria japonica TaxID=3369 RepID=UPI0025AC57EF|nr:uncharacterized protein LOC131036391 isoform X2 [Cryptomeria japonica]